MFLSQLFTLAEKDLCNHTNEQLIHKSCPSESQEVSGLQPDLTVKFESTKGFHYPWPTNTIIFIYNSHLLCTK